MTGGEFAGPRLGGEVLPGGGDWLFIRPDGTWELDVRITLRTHDGALIYVRFPGLNVVPPAVQERQRRGERVASTEYYFRVTPAFETAAEPYRWLNDLIVVGVGETLADGVRYRVYAIR